MFSEVPTFNPTLPNGVSSFIEAVSKQLARIGHEVHVYEGKTYFGQKKEQKIGENITIHRSFSLPLSHYQGLRIPIPVGSVFKGLKEELDIIHAHGPINGIGASAIAKVQRNVIAKVITFHTPGHMYTSYIPSFFAPVRSGYFIDSYEKLIYNSFDLILTPAETIRKNLIRRNFEAQKIFVLPNCVNLTENHNRLNEERMHQLRNQLGIDGKKVITYVGRMSPEKRIPDIINMVPRIVQEEPDTHFLIVGKGPYLENYRTMAQKVDPAHITFTGYVSNYDLANLLHLSNIGVLFVNGAQIFDITLLNYWSNALPVCVRRAGGMGDVISHRDNGLLFDTYKEAFNQILTLLQDEKLSKQLGKRGFETVKNKYTVEKITKTMLDYYKIAADQFHTPKNNYLSLILKSLIHKKV